MLVSNLCVRLSFIFLAITLSLFQTSLDSGLAIEKKILESLERKWSRIWRLVWNLVSEESPWLSLLSSVFSSRNSWTGLGAVYNEETMRNLEIWKMNAVILVSLWTMSSCGLAQGQKGRYVWGLWCTEEHTSYWKNREPWVTMLLFPLSPYPS
jgi:hypothetical protein